MRLEQLSACAAVTAGCFFASGSVAAENTQKPLAQSSYGPSTSRHTQPNIIFILTDDQDSHMTLPEHIPLIKKHIIDKGTLYQRHYCTTAICCPARASLLTGKLAHNTNVTDLSPPFGGFPAFIENGHNDRYMPVYLQEAGYNTYYTGKIFNAHATINYNKPHLKGWTGSDFLMDPSTYDYWSPVFQRNHDAPINYTGQYSTDLVAEKAYGFLEDAVVSGKPFFLGIAPIAPHTNVEVFSAPENDTSPITDDMYRVTPPLPAKRHEHLFPGVKVPRTENFNPDHAVGAGWVRRQPKLTDAEIEHNDGHYRARLQSLQAVDEMVDSLIQRLEQHGVLDNTYIFYTTDNGYHISHWRLHPGKECGFETDINVPLYVRGPRIPEGHIAKMVTAHHDLLPTFLHIAGAPLKADFDGVPIPLTTEEQAKAAYTQEHVNVEYWGYAASENQWNYIEPNGDEVRHITNNTYKGLRMIGEGYNLYYSVWCEGDHELYDLTTDPSQMRNLLNDEHTDLASRTMILGFPIAQIVDRLDSLLLVLKTCKGITCQQPWHSLHPNGQVTNLREALSPRFDGFYTQQPRVSFAECVEGHVRALEGPQFEQDGFVHREDSNWSLWT